MLDSQTTIFLAALTFTLLPLLTWWLAPSEVLDAGAAWWQVGSVIAAVGLGLLSLRTALPLWVGAHGANTCLLISLLLWAHSLRCSLGRAWPTPAVLLVCLLAAGYYSWTYATLTPSTRIAANRVVLGALALQVAHLSWQLGRRDKSHNALALMGCFALLGLGLWASAWLASQTELVFMASGIIKEIPGSPALLTLTTATAGSFGYLGLLLDRSRGLRDAVLRTRVAAEENARLDAKLQVLDRQQRLVLASGSLAHELNQPLTAALTEAQLAQRLLRATPFVRSSVQDLLDRALLSVGRTSAILNRIRDAAYSSEPPSSRVDLREVVQKSCDLMQAQFHQAGISVQLSVADKPLFCIGDDLLFSQVLVNLLRNSAQALQEAPVKSLEIRAFSAPWEVVLELRDHGPGFSALVLERWGQPFVDSSTKGLGLGLAISLAIVNQYGGHLLLRNHPEGGALVTLKLPVLAEVLA